MGELEDLLLDLYTLQNPGRDGLPAKIKALIASILPLTGDFYQSWYRDAVLKRFYLEVMRTGVVEAMGNMNMPIKDPVLSEIRHNRILRQFMGIAISTVINWYVLIPMAYLFGYVHLPEVNLAEWLPLTKALEAEVKKILIWSAKLLPQVLNMKWWKSGSVSTALGNMVCAPVLM